MTPLPWHSDAVGGVHPIGYRFEVKSGALSKPAEKAIAEGTKTGRATFRCLLTGANIAGAYIDAEAQAGRMSSRLMAVVAEGLPSRLYLTPSAVDEAAAAAAQQHVAGHADEMDLPRQECRGTFASNAQGRRYSFKTFADYFTSRQLVALTTFSDLVGEALGKVVTDADAPGLMADGAVLHAGGAGVVAYADAIATYLAFAISKVANIGSSVASWMSDRGAFRETFARQGIPMVWDFAESNPFADAGGSLDAAIDKGAMVIAHTPACSPGAIKNLAAQENSFSDYSILVSTDPPYYDNICYADLSDFFYVWLRRSLSGVWPELFRRLLTPKAEELVATPYRHGGTEQAEAFFMKGMGEALTAMCAAATDGEPLAIYYAFKQAEVAEGGITSAGWASFLQAAVNSGLAIDGTWPVRTESAGRIIAKDSNALASSVVLVCRKRSPDAPTVTRAEFVRALKREMPDAIDDIRKAGVGPVDMQQSVIGPGIGVFTRCAKVLEDDDATMTVKTALTLINRVWEEIESELDANFDAETQVALAWFATYGFDSRASGELITLANAKNVPLGALFTTGVFKDLHGRACLMPRGELPAGWDPTRDNGATVWECVQHTARVLAAEDGGAAAAASLVARMGPKAREARLLAERLYLISTQKGWASEALVYNQLAQEWAHLEDVAMGIDALAPPGAAAQGSLALAGGRTA